MEETPNFDVLTCSQGPDLGQEQINEIEQKAQAKSTKKATEWGLKEFDKWCEKRAIKVWSEEDHHGVLDFLSVIAVSLIPHGTDSIGYIAGRVTLGSLGKMFITTSFDSLFIFSGKLFPTVVRNSEMGMVSIASRLGAACAPFVVQMTRINPVMPFAFMGGLTMFGALLCSILPETRGRSTAEVFEDTAEKQREKEHALEEHKMKILVEEPPNDCSDKEQALKEEKKEIPDEEPLVDPQ